MAYLFAKVRAGVPGYLRDIRPGYDAIRKDNWAVLAPAKLWGAFSGLFGPLSNELIVVACGEVGGVGEALANHPMVRWPDRADDVLLLEPTVRPTTDEPRTREGVYVFRFFHAAAKHVDEIVRLSAEAWPHFENVDHYRAIPQGLFRLKDTDHRVYGRLLLCTWYDGLASWEESRTPPGPARDLFQRRHALIESSRAYATRLITD